MNQNISVLIFLSREAYLLESLMIFISMTFSVQRGNDAHTREESDDGPSLIVNGNDAEVMEYPYYV